MRIGRQTLRKICGVRLSQSTEYGIQALEPDVVGELDFHTARSNLCKIGCKAQVGTGLQPRYIVSAVSVLGPRCS